ncbi:hypothetical protein [Chitiniphilus shinanonensis]|uniref:hypothetical protein n=1 Tax=Chitiniphilus shinanonensis TaxID=553088 RepID=UPI003342A8C0
MKARIRNYWRLVMALVLAPALATFVIPVGNCLVGGALGNPANCLAGMTGYAWYGLLPAAIATVCLGVPLLFIVLRAGWVKAWQFVICGIGVGACTSLLLGLADHHLDTLGMLAIATPASVVAASVVWLVGVRRNLASDATTARRDVCSK